MRVLLIKTSSMGDLIHTLPALTDAAKAIPGIKFDWVVEESFAEIPHWHPSVGKVIPVALRRWRKNVFAVETRQAWKKMTTDLREHQYDLVLDAQSLMKSAFVSLFARGTRAGLDWGSAREATAAIFYQRKFTVNFHQHAVVRMRSLFSLALGYPLPTSEPDFGLHRDKLIDATNTEKYLVFLHGTTWTTKQWPEEYWIQLAKLAEQAGYRVKISGGSDAEVARAYRIAKSCAAVDAMPRLKIVEMATLLANAKGAVAVDTGFGHLAAALDLPTVSIYGSTNPDYTGVIGKTSIHLKTDFACSPCLSRECKIKEASSIQPPCYATVPPVKVWGELKAVL